MSFGLSTGKKNEKQGGNEKGAYEQANLFPDEKYDSTSSDIEVVVYSDDDIPADIKVEGEFEVIGSTNEPNVSFLTESIAGGNLHSFLKKVEDFLQKGEDDRLLSEDAVTTLKELLAALLLLELCHGKSADDFYSIAQSRKSGNSAGASEEASNSTELSKMQKELRKQSGNMGYNFYYRFDNVTGTLLCMNRSAERRAYSIAVFMHQVKLHLHNGELYQSSINGGCKNVVATVATTLPCLAILGFLALSCYYLYLIFMEESLSLKESMILFVAFFALMIPICCPSWVNPSAQDEHDRHMNYYNRPEHIENLVRPNTYTFWSEVAVLRYQEGEQRYLPPQNSKQIALDIPEEISKFCENLENLLHDELREPIAIKSARS